MSRFIGPIHEALYKKIMFLIQIDEYLAHTFHEDYKPVIENLSLEEVIDGNRIHESLQELILSAQKEHGRHCSELYQQSKEVFLDALTNFGKTQSLKISLTQVMESYQSIFLHGMPCDRNLRIETEDECVKVELKQELALQYYSDEEIYRAEREALMKGLLPNTIQFKQTSSLSFTFTERKLNWEEQMLHEHDQILRLCEALNRQTLAILKHKTVDIAWFKRCLYFIENYADKQHHAVEEKALFEPLSKVSDLGKVLVENGMLVEHQQARYYVKSLKKRLQCEIQEQVLVEIIGFSQSYIDLIKRHIEKENKVAYPYARKMLSSNVIEQHIIEINPQSFEEEMENFLNEI